MTTFILIYLPGGIAALSTTIMIGSIHGTIPTRMAIIRGITIIGKRNPVERAGFIANDMTVCVNVVSDDSFILTAQAARQSQSVTIGTDRYENQSRLIPGSRPIKRIAGIGVKREKRTASHPEGGCCQQ